MNCHKLPSEQNRHANDTHRNGIAITQTDEMEHIIMVFSPVTIFTDRMIAYATALQRIFFSINFYYALQATKLFVVILMMTLR